MNVNVVTPMLSRSWRPLTFGVGQSPRDPRDHPRQSYADYQARSSRQRADAATVDDTARRAREKAAKTG